MNRSVELIEEALGSRQILRGVYRYTVVQDRDHLYGVAVFDETQHLYSFGTLQGSLLEPTEVLESLACEAVEAQLAQVLRPVALGVWDGLAREHEGLAAGRDDDLDDVVVQDGADVDQLGVGVHGAGAGRSEFQGLGDIVDGGRRDERLVALDVDVSVGWQAFGDLCDAVGAGEVLPGADAVDAEFAARCFDAFVVRRDDGSVEAFGLQAALVDVPEQRHAAEEGQWFAGEAGGTPAAWYDGDVPAPFGGGRSGCGGGHGVLLVVGVGGLQVSWASLARMVGEAVVANGRHW